MDQDKEHTELATQESTIKTLSSAVVELNQEQLEKKLGYSNKTKEDFATLRAGLSTFLANPVPLKHTTEEIGHVFKIPNTTIVFIHSPNDVWEVRMSTQESGIHSPINRPDKRPLTRFFLSEKPLAGDDFIDNFDVFPSPMWQFLKTKEGDDESTITISLDNKGFAQSVQSQSPFIDAGFSSEIAKLRQKEETLINIANLGRVGDYWLYSGAETMS